jgi:branched-chain amino acid transport system permease protein
MISIIWLWFRGEVLYIPGRIIGVLFLIALMVLPVFVSNPYYLRIVVLAAIFSMFAASWDFLAGVTGQINLGQGLFFGTSSYCTALLHLHLGLSPWLSIPAGVVGALIVGLLAGFPALRLRGFYLALVTLALPTIAGGLLFLAPEVTGGELGVSGLRPLMKSRIATYYLVTILAMVSVLILWKLSDPKAKIVRSGIIFHAICDDEITARSSGIDTNRHKLIAFAVSGMFSGLAGSLYAHFLQVATPSTLEMSFSLQVILWTIFGGMGTIYGSVAGVFILFPATELMSLYPASEPYKLVGFSSILILTLLFMPEGLCVWILDKLEIKCPRCKVVNFSRRKVCRACDSLLYINAGEGI